MRRLQRAILPLAVGGVNLGVLQGAGLVDFNQILFQFLATLLSLIVRVLLGGDVSGTSTGV